MGIADIPDYRYLIVEDDQVTSGLIMTLLKKQGALHIEAADNGKAAIKFMEAADTFPDIIICDLNMPDMDGVEFVQYLAQKYFNGGLVLMSGSAKSMLNAVRRLGQARYLKVLDTLPKPFQPEALLTCLAKYNKTVRDASSDASSAPIK